MSYFLREARLRPAAAIAPIFLAPYFFLPMLAAIALALAVLCPLLFNLPTRALKRPPEPSLGFDVLPLRAIFILPYAPIRTQLYCVALV